MANQYLETKVTTASQPELQLMLLEGALRHGRIARETLLGADQQGRHHEEMKRTLDILEALVQGTAGGSHPLSKSCEEQFAFLFRQAAMAQINQDPHALDQVLQLIAYHRQTWQMACENLRNPQGDSSPQPASDRAASGPAASTPIAHHLAPADQAYEAGGLSLEA